jgi:hypothetical protein
MEREVDSYNNVLFYTANDEQMDQRTLSALSHLSRGYDMVQVIRCLTTMTKSYGSTQDTVYQTPKEKYIRCFITENAWYQGRLEKDGWASAQSPF